MFVYKVYTDPGFSGATLDRPTMQEMLADLAAGKIDGILAYKIDRLTRSPRDFYYLIDIFDSHKAAFISVTESFDTASPSGRLMRNIMLTFAQFEREAIKSYKSDSQIIMLVLEAYFCKRITYTI